jgi:tripeptidyl-peptidase I
MHLLGLATFILGIGLSIASPISHNSVRHEKRAASPEWIRRTRAAPETKFPVRIGLSQSNLHLGHDRLMEVSDPRSEKYGQYMSAQEVGDLFRPSRDSVTKVREWLHSSGIDSERHEVSAGRGWLKFEASIDELESLLATEYHIFQHTLTQEDHIGCSEYHLPQYIQEHVDFITPAVSFSKLKDEGKLKRKRAQNGLSPASLQPKVQPAGQNSLLADTELPCYTAVTPDCIRRTYPFIPGTCGELGLIETELYNIPMGTTAYPGNEIGIFEDGDYYDQEDLDLTFGVIAPYIPNGTHPILHGIDGGYAPMDGYVGLESLLDMSLIFPLVYPQQAILFQVDDLREVEMTQGFGDTFLDALDAVILPYLT